MPTHNVATIPNQHVAQHLRACDGLLDAASDGLDRFS
jgi:hypothetical protein